MLKHIPRKKESTREFIYRTLKQSIIEFYFIPGDKISEPSIASELNVSRTPVREALILLENEGLVDIRSKQGTFVSKIDVADIRNLVFMRKTVEREIIAIACEKRTEESLASLKEELQAQKVFLKIKDGRVSMFLLDNSFHRIIYEIDGHGDAWKLLQKNGGALNRLRTLEVLDINYTDRRYQENVELAEIIEKQQLEKISAFVDRHLDALENTLPRLMEAYPNYFS
ncbi:GntR family transcriptional regulator [Enterococcus sp. HY326]|uniref:GntR family transcriptional regulator n=1 Tax=Enterococcus sp. HY326 TaxID=2971265 RepID=UPI00223EA606|nr:GntR family transcriptional regulator [Enterococcus sp. HY326]